MDGSEYSYWHALGGGILIGAASFLGSAVTGKIPGISGIFGRLFRPVNGDSQWRIVFLIGLVGAAAVVVALSDAAAVYRPVSSLPIVAVSGLLVGFGTRLGGGCTSGHGVCGSGLGAHDSMVATGIFMVSAVATVLVAKQF
ncbi:YeeE/YedE thiosulfate transporter family protein [Verrucomicrobiales bacterium]|nr:YeeE/YedE thiosulfate transporter family protein [Verrucomicrobiales bacterium]